MSSTNTRKTTGQYHSTKGTLVELVGDVTGSDCWERSGKEEHAEGESEIAAAQVKGYAEGTIDRVGGKTDAIAGAVAGNK